MNRALPEMGFDVRFGLTMADIPADATSQLNDHEYPCLPWDPRCRCQSYVRYPYWYYARKTHDGMYCEVTCIRLPVFF